MSNSRTSSTSSSSNKSPVVGDVRGRRFCPRTDAGQPNSASSSSKSESSQSKSEDPPSDQSSVPFQANIADRLFNYRNQSAYDTLHQSNRVPYAVVAPTATTFPTDLLTDHRRSCGSSTHPERGSNFPKHDEPPTFGCFGSVRESEPSSSASSCCSTRPPVNSILVPAETAPSERSVMSTESNSSVFRKQPANRKDQPQHQLPLRYQCSPSSSLSSFPSLSPSSKNADSSSTTGTSTCHSDSCPDQDYSKPFDPPPANCVDDNLLNRQRAMHKHQADFTDQSLSPQEKASLLLLHLLQKMNIQLYAFDAIFRWALQCANELGYDFHSKPPSRQNVINQIAQKRGLQQLRPVTTTLNLPATQIQTNITTASIRECIYSILTDPLLMKKENLLFNGTSPFDPPPDPYSPNPDHIFDDINSGTVYYDAWKRICTPTEPNNVLLPLVFFIDKSFFDKKGKLNSEPVTFTLGIFKRHVRNNNTNAWRSIGCIPDAFMAGYHEPIDKASDYHYMLKHMFAELKLVQASCGISWDIKYNGTHRVEFKPVIHMIITDTKAADDMVGKIQFRGTSADRLPARLCRFCDIPSKEIDSPYFDYNLTSSSEIEALYAQEHHQQLRDISYRPIHNAFWELVLSDAHGINGCMPPDALHVLLKGTHIYTRECFFDILRLTAQERRDQESRQRNREKDTGANSTNRNAAKRKRARKVGNRNNPNDQQSAFTSVVVAQLTEEQLGHYRIFTKTSKPAFEAIALSISKQLKRQSDRDMPRVHFSQGITENFSKLSGTEETGVLLLILLSLASSAGSTMFTSSRQPSTYIGTEKYSLWIGTIE